MEYCARGNEWSCDTFTRGNQWEYKHVWCSVVFNSFRLHGRMRLMELSRLHSPWNFPGKNTGVDCYFLLQEIFPAQGSNLSLLCHLHWQAVSCISWIGRFFTAGPPGNPTYMYGAQSCPTLCDTIHILLGCKVGKSVIL